MFAAKGESTMSQYNSQYQNYDTQGYQNNYGPRTTRRKSLLIGINYEGQQSALRGCRQDVRNMVSRTTPHLPWS